MEPRRDKRTSSCKASFKYILRVKRNIRPNVLPLYAILRKAFFDLLLISLQLMLSFLSKKVSKI